MNFFDYCVQHVEKKKIQIYFLSPLGPDGDSSYVYYMFMNHFGKRKHKKSTFVYYDKADIEGLLCYWETWKGFLLRLGFKSNAEACAEILNDLFNKITEPQSHIDDLMKATIIKPQPREWKDKKLDEKTRKHYENMEIKRRLENMEEEDEF